ncbi:MAG: ATP-binding protein [Bacteroidota bacterium]
MRKFRILYVEDNRTDFEMVKAILEDREMVDLMYRVEKKSEFQLILERERIDIILTDYSLPAFHGIEVIQLACDDYPDIPVIMVTGNLSDEIAVEVIKRGAWDYVLKENIYRLIPVIESSLKRQIMKREKDTALKTLCESENNYRELSESSPYGILVHVRGRVFYHNRAAARLIMGSENGSFLGIKLIDYVNAEYRRELISRMEKLYRGERPEKPREYPFRNVEGKDLILEIASSPITFHGYPAAQVIFNDIAERKKAENELKKAKERAEESDRLKTAFLENLSHEIRTPLNGIIGFTNLLKLRKVTEEEKNSYIKIIEDSGNYLINIIDDLIEVSRIETGQFELRKIEFNLNHLLQEIYKSFDDDERYRERHIVLVLTCGLKLEEAILYTDKDRLRQLLNNLLYNAYKFTDEGKIEFGYELIRQDKLRFFVRDTGIGIPESSKEIIFERFRKAENSLQSTSGGNGLGLTICRGIVEAMKGRIWFDSEVERGSDFYFEIPFKRQKEERSFSEKAYSNNS